MDSSMLLISMSVVMVVGSIIILLGYYTVTSSLYRIVTDGKEFKVEEKIVFSSWRTIGTCPTIEEARTIITQQKAEAKAKKKEEKKWKVVK